MHRSFTPTSWLWTPVLITGLLTACSSPNNPPRADMADWKNATQGRTILPDFMPDPYEPVNRAMWAANEGILVGVMQPSGKIYRTVVPKPVRGSINDFTHNIIYPGRVVNNMLQGRWAGAGDETLRFITNTTVGGLGFFDVASKWNIPKSEADFGQTFGKWGWQSHSYVVLPFFGPSDDRHAIGLAADEFAEPWNYKYPYTLGSYGSTYNQAIDKTEDALRLSQVESDSYVQVKYAWTYGSKDQPPHWQPNGPPDKATLQTLGAARYACEDPDFPSNGREISVRIPSTGRNLKFNYWLQKGPAPLVYIVPGLSSHRLSMQTLIVAENLHRNGFSVVTTTSVFHPEFMENASTTPLPIYPPVDSRDLLVALTAADHALTAKYPHRLGKRALVGCSMGGFLTLRLAAYEKSAPPDLLHFDRYVAIDAPVDLVHAALRVDAFQNAPMAWPAAQRQALVNNTLHKATLSGALTSPANTAPLFSGIESKYLIGLTFRVTLRDIIFSSQMRNNMGVIQTPLSTWHRESAYQEIMNYSYKDYFLKLAAPYYQKQGLKLADVTRESNLRACAGKFRAQPKLRLLANRNDFLLPTKDLAWLKSVFPPSRLTVFPDGGHLGNLNTPAVENAILTSLSGLK